MLQEFKKFIMRGNVLDLAVAVVIGAAFKAVVDSFVADVIMKIVGAIVGKPSFADLQIKLKSAKGATPATYLTYGNFLTVVVNFLIVAAAIFVMIKSFEKLQARRNKGEEAAEPESLSTEAAVLTEIRDLLKAQAAGGAAGGATPAG